MAEFICQLITKRRIFVIKRVFSAKHQNIHI
jgi:hypothetical protein